MQCERKLYYGEIKMLKTIHYFSLDENQLDSKI